MSDLAIATDGSAPQSTAKDRGLPDEELVKSLAEAIRRVEGAPVEPESRVERPEKDLRRATG